MHKDYTALQHHRLTLSLFQTLIRFAISKPMLNRGIETTCAAIRHRKTLATWAISASSGTPEYYVH
jgi:hypothetical protein